jgi:hypothetical protein
MSDMQQQAPTRRATARVPQQRGAPAPTPSGAWTGWVLFGALMMVLLGSFQMIAGLVALFNDTYYRVGSSGLLVHVDYSAWGWVHLVIGAAAMATGFGLLAGAGWARIPGVVLAVLSTIVNLGFLAATPVWATLMIALDVIVIYALTAHGREIQGWS